MTELVNLKLEEITVGEGVRRPIEEDSIKELSASFARHGVLQPVLVQPREGRYELLIGVRRLLAARRAGLETTPALVLDEPLKPDEAIEARLIENLQREGLDPLDEAGAYLALKGMGYSLAAIGRRLEDPERQLALAEEVQAEGLSVHETRQRVREMLGKEFRWRLVPVRLSLDVYEALQRIAPEGDVKRLIQETIEKLIQT